MTMKVERAGERGPRVLLVQGTGVRGRAWQPQIDGLVERCQLAWYDNRGLGDNPGRVGSVEDMGRDALEVLDQLGWSSATLVGHSLGGVIAQQVAVLAPERVDGLGLLCTFAVGSASISWHPSDMWLNLRTAVGTAAMRRRAFFELVSDPSVDVDLEAIERLEQVFGRRLDALPPAAFPQVLALARTDLRKQLSWRGRTLVVSARDDRIAKPAQGRMLAELLDGRFELVDGGHAVVVQDAARINQLLVDELLTGS